jgi:sortase B
MARLKRKYTVKGKVALVVAVLCLFAAIGIIAGIIMQRDAATNFELPIKVESGAGYVSPINWRKWQKINPDVVAWITIPKTSINYPVVQAPKDNPTYYLSHDVYKRYNIFGCLYVDAECTINGEQVVIFGHHFTTDNKIGFGQLIKFHSFRFMEKHSIIYIYTPTETRVIDIRSASKINAASTLKETDFDSFGDLLVSYKSQWDMAATRKGDKFVSDDQMNQVKRVYTLVTCSYFSFYNERTLVNGLE